MMCVVTGRFVFVEHIVRQSTWSGNNIVRRGCSDYRVRSKLPWTHRTTKTLQCSLKTSSHEHKELCRSVRESCQSTCLFSVSTCIWTSVARLYRTYLVK